MSNLLLSLLIGFLGLDTTIAFQVLISQPIFACPILGWLLGNPALGMEIGIMMQLIWLNVLPVGAAVFLEGNIASMVTCAIAIQFEELNLPNLVFTAAFVIGMAVSYLGAQLTVLDRKLNGLILKLTLEAAQKASLKQIALLDFTSVLIYFLMMSALAYVALWGAGQMIPLLIENLPSPAEQKLEFVKPAVWGLGISLTLPMIFRILRQKS
ncbi:MAG: PTS sugar transporter subunit IIC [Calditrichaceae bacterium]|nr:PTS sugar transporter subunit IIC [Calditrichia bacterium]NUQ40308.1 PTS sugar transporter subunit IIC [Calditrichaceae bacterium]